MKRLTIGTMVLDIINTAVLGSPIAVDTIVIHDNGYVDVTIKALVAPSYRSLPIATVVRHARRRILTVRQLITFINACFADEIYVACDRRYDDMIEQVAKDLSYGTYRDDEQMYRWAELHTHWREICSFFGHVEAKRRLKKIIIFFS